jgi:hypothetical protein
LISTQFCSASIVMATDFKSATELMKELPRSSR